MALEIYRGTQRGIAEGLTEEELAIFDILTKREPALTKAEEAEAKKVCRELLVTLTREKLTMFLVSRDAQDRPCVEPGILLSEVLRGQGFLANPTKTRGTGRDGRQMVTGIVVNDGLRVPAKFANEVHRALHLWKRFGVVDAATRAVPVLRRKSYLSGAQPSLPKLIRGKLAWLAAVNGRSDQRYQTLAKQFNSLVLRDKLPEL